MIIELVPYSPQWALDYENEARRIREALGDLVLNIEHIGSTAVPGLAAKPIVDVQVGIESLAAFEAADGFERMAAAGYEYLSAFDSQEWKRRFFVREADNVRLANIHVVPSGNPWYQRHIFLRDYLRGSAEARARYQQFKAALCQQDWPTGSHYAEAKTRLIKELEEEAYDRLGISDDNRHTLRASRD